MLNVIYFGFFETVKYDRRGPDSPCAVKKKKNLIPDKKACLLEQLLRVQCKIFDNFTLMKSNLVSERLFLTFSVRLNYGSVVTCKA